MVEKSHVTSLARKYPEPDPDPKFWMGTSDHKPLEAWRTRVNAESYRKKALENIYLAWLKKRAVDCFAG